MPLKSGRVGLKPSLVTTDGRLKASAVKSPLPSHTASDAGKMLQVANDNTLLWGVPSSGGFSHVERHKILGAGYTAEHTGYAIIILSASGNDITGRIMEDDVMISSISCAHSSLPYFGCIPITAGKTYTIITEAQFIGNSSIIIFY